MREQNTKIELTPQWVLQLTEAQSRLLAFLLKRLGSHDQAQEVLQEVNLVLCRDAYKFEEGTDFMAWAFAIARFQLMAFRKRQSRDRLVFPVDLTESLASLDEKMFPVEANAQRTKTLNDCIQKLSPEHRTLLLRRYAEASSVKAIAADSDKTANAISLTLHRIREQLIKCVAMNKPTGVDA
ncbi:RNA polymerase sigma factor [Planctomycetes bacterium CA13]|uniref:RNA polymerase sigma factor n=1 Tax=Novipirellula herctigrandis TaxID=2527986 RepID=A0A5C5ZCJ3_9BACT|nr:RNA polymerase sigma factor [Planctomycetes bacterium CA13]